MITGGDAYGVSKAEGERLALELGRARGVEVVALRPTLVYGPAAPYWVVGYCERVKQEQVALVDGGVGLANLIFVEDLVDAMWAAAEAPGRRRHVVPGLGRAPGHLGRVPGPLRPHVRQAASALRPALARQARDAGPARLRHAHPASPPPAGHGRAA